MQSGSIVKGNLRRQKAPCVQSAGPGLNKFQFWPKGEQSITKNRRANIFFNWFLHLYLAGKKAAPFHLLGWNWRSPLLPLAASSLGQVIIIIIIVIFTVIFVFAIVVDVVITIILMTVVIKSNLLGRIQRRRWLLTFRVSCRWWSIFSSWSPDLNHHPLVIADWRNTERSNFSLDSSMNTWRGFKLIEGLGKEKTIGIGKFPFQLEKT